MIKRILALFKDTFWAWRQDDPARLAAAISYYTIFSLAPLLVLAITLLGQIYPEGARERIVTQVSRYLGIEVANALGTLIESAQAPSAGAVAAIIAAITLFFGASGVFAQVMYALDDIWHVQPAPGRGVLGTVKDRFMAFGMVLVSGIIFVLTLVATFVINRVNEVAGIFAPSWLDFAPILNIVLSFILTALLFAAIYLVLPRVTLSWRDVIIGGAVTAALFVLGIEVISFYISASDPSSGYGAAGSLVILLVFVYYSAQIFLLGAEFTKLYARRFGSQVRVESGAIRYRIVTADEPTIRAVAGAVPQEEVQLVARPLQEEPEQRAVPRTTVTEPPSHEKNAISAGMIVAVTVAFVVGLIIGGGRR